jgi:hypothetical protein
MQPVISDSLIETSMFIVFGFANRQRRVRSGPFFCCRCRADRNYHHMKTQRWFTLYLLPVFPIKTFGEYVACESCGAAFPMNAIDYAPANRDSDRYAALANCWRAAQISIACIFGAPTHRQLEHVRASLMERWGEASDLDALRADCGNPPPQGVSMEIILAAVEKLRQELSPEAKRDFMRTAVKILSEGDGSKQPEPLLAQIRTALDAT